MPTYEYRCKACSHEWEAFQPITARPLRKCPDCGRLKAERIISAGGGILFRGSGFYQTDYRSESWKKGEKADKKAQESSSSDSKSSSNGTASQSKSSSAAPSSS